MSNMEGMKLAVIKEAEKEERKSYDNHEKFNSTHEGYAVIKEEMDEAVDEIKLMTEHGHRLWNRIKNDENTMEHIEKIEETAINCAAELIQVIAMCKKYKSSISE